MSEVRNVATRLVQPSSTRSLSKEDGSPSPQFNLWLKMITDKSMIIGTGSPESVVEATAGALYMDDSGTTGSILYIKKLADISGDKKQGWVLV